MHRAVRQSMEAVRHQLWREIMHMWCCYQWCVHHAQDLNDKWNLTNDMDPEDMFFFAQKNKSECCMHDLC